MKENGIFWLTLMKEESLGLAGQVFRSTIAGALWGILLAILLYVLLKKSRFLPPSGKKAQRIGTLLFYLLLLPIGMGFVGFNQGVIRGADHFVHEGPFSKEVMPGLGKGLAAAVLILDGIMQNADPSSPEAAIAPGPALNVPAFQKRLESTTQSMMDAALPKISTAVKKQLPTLGAGVGEKAFDWLIQKFGANLLQSALKQNAGKQSWSKPVAVWFKGLSEAAGATLGPGLISPEELAEYSAETIVHTFILQPFSAGFKLQKTCGYGLVLVIVILPVFLLMKNRKKTPPPPPLERPHPDPAPANR